MKTGRTKLADTVMTTRSAHKNGSWLYVELSFGVVKDLSGTVLGAFAIGRDGTARHLAETAARARMAELEKRVQGTAGPTG